MAEKPKLAMYWASSCGGCEISLVNLHEKILDVDRAFDFVFCPCLLDTKEKDIEAMPDGAIALTLFNGAIRNADNEQMARLLRNKSQLLIAFGSCAGAGCIPALSNLSERDAHFRTNYFSSPSLSNPEGLVPEQVIQVPEGELALPAFYESVRTLAQTVDVDYFIPGCPPESNQVWNVVEAIIEGKLLPPHGSVLGAGKSSVCDECKRHKNDKRIRNLYRAYEVIPDSDTCLLEQGLLCMGIATRDGCGALCPQVNMPCVGCYGPPEGVRDQGAKMIAALGSIIDGDDNKNLDEKTLRSKVNDIIGTIPDLAGTFYKFSLAGSILQRRRTGCSKSQ
jgi:F420-non-reducing hydrogenase small subunit